MLMRNLYRKVLWEEGGRKRHKRIVSTSMRELNKAAADVGGILSPEWYIEYLDRRGKRVRRKACRDKEASQRMLARVADEEERIRMGETAPVQYEAELANIAEQYVIHMQQTGKRTRSIEAFWTAFNLITREAGLVYVADLAPRTIRQWMMDRRAGGTKPQTVNNRLGWLSRMMDWAEVQDMVRSNPLRKVSLMEPEPRRGVLPLDVTALARLLDVADPDYATRWIFHWMTGWRLTAATRLRWEQVDLNAGIVTLPPDDGNKTRRGHVTPLAPVLAERLAAMQAARFKTDSKVATMPSGLVFRPSRKRGPDGERQPVGREQVWRRLKTHCKAAGIETENRDEAGRVIESVTVHSFRHGCADFLRKEFGIDMASAFIGHAPVTTLGRHYAHIEVDELRPMAVALSEALDRALGTNLARGQDGAHESNTGPAGA